MTSFAKRRAVVYLLGAACLIATGCSHRGVSDAPIRPRGREAQKASASRAISEDKYRNSSLGDGQAVSGGVFNDQGEIISGPIFHSGTEITSQAPPPTGGTANPNGEPYDATFYEHAGVNPFIDTEDDPFSTFALDVDTASYVVARRYILDGNLPDRDSARVEEFVNYFRQDYAPPAQGAFAVHLDGAPSPFGGENHWLLRAGVRGKDIADKDRKNASLVFVIDVSGSMNREDRLGLVKQSLALLVKELRPSDRVGIVIYGSNGEVLLPSTSAEKRANILEAIEKLESEGSTNAEEGLRLGYEMAAKNFREGWINRVILCSDGVANTGQTGPGSLLKLIQKHREKGVTLTTVGFGMGNYNDVLMERLANDGDGSYHYVDALPEARRVFVENLGGTLQNIARDAKIQVEFDPAVVSRWRLIGYENRDIADEDFRDDSVDAGEIGAGHNVTALYELKLKPDAPAGRRLASVRLRWLDPETREASEMERVFLQSDFAPSFEDASARLQLDATVAEFAEILRGSYWAKRSDLEGVATMARRVASLLPEDADAMEFAYLAGQAAKLKAARQ